MLSTSCICSVLCLHVLKLNLLTINPGNIAAVVACNLTGVMSLQVHLSTICCKKQRPREKVADLFYFLIFGSVNKQGTYANFMKLSLDGIP